ncbi:hypothetical protein EV561_13014 [Rhizobium sp. BK376]|nr:hypothetical protein EV561_13014 [Rhizobium sp. BK376]
MKLHFSRNPNPRLAVAVARLLDTEIEFQFAEPMAPGQSERYRPPNPNLLLPILEHASARTLGNRCDCLLAITARRLELLAN